MHIQKFSGGSYLTNSYLVHDCDEAIVIDVPAHTEKKIREFLEENNIKLKYIIATHIHWDHVEDLVRLKKHTNALIAVHKMDEESQNEINSIFEGEAGAVKSGMFLEDGQIITVGSENFRIIHTPGHTPGSICLYNEKVKLSKLPPETIVYPGHGAETTIGNEKWLKNI